MAAPAAGDSAPPPPSASSKGKAKMDVDEAVEEPMCGICLTKSPHAIRGELDGCAHRFCFVCIMTWALHESRCPFCDAPFRAVRRPPVAGRFPSDHVVPVPHRDQVHGNGSNTVDADPYADTTCSVCNSPDDGALLMLCDLCDSAAAAHTYCVGLGDTVPEEDWFCSDCAAAREEHFRILQLEKHRWLGQPQLEHELNMSIEALRVERAALAAPRTRYEGERTPALYRTNGLHAGGLPRKLWEVLQVLGYKKAPVYKGLKRQFGDDREAWKVEVRIYGNEPDQEEEEEEEEDGVHGVSKTHRARAPRFSFEAGIRDAAHRALLAICDEHREALKTTKYRYYYLRHADSGSISLGSALEEDVGAALAEEAELAFMLVEERAAEQHELEVARGMVAQQMMRCRILKAQDERNRMLAAQMDAEDSHPASNPEGRLPVFPP
ncbi:hypothetical protein ACP70R_028246 [Stipagrostis hirtigluma subsp. patula]